MSIYTLAAIGGLLPDVLKIIEKKLDPTLPSEFKNFNYWLALIFQVGVGILTVYLLKDGRNMEMNSITATACGFAGSSILTRVLGAIGNAISPKSKSLVEGPKSVFQYWTL